MTPTGPPDKRPPDPRAFHPELPRHLRAGPGSVPPRLGSTVDRSLGTRPALASTRSSRRYPGPTGVVVLFLALAIGALVVLGSIAVVMGLVGSRPAAVVDTGAAAASQSPAGTKSASTIEPQLLAELSGGLEPAGLVPDPRGGALFIDELEATVLRANLKNGKVAHIARSGDKVKDSDHSMGEPVDLTAAGSDVIIVDDQGRPWRWRASNAKGAGTLAPVRLQGRDGFGADHGDVEASDPDAGDYRMYVVEPGLDQVLRYQQALDRQSFLPPSEYLASTTSDVDRFEQLYVDFDVYALADDRLRRFRYGKWDGGFELEQPPGAIILGPGHDYRLVNGSGRQDTDGRFYLYDAANDRMVGFSKVDGSYLGEWTATGDEMADVRGMFVVEGGLNKKGKRKNDDLIWVTPEGIYRATLRVEAAA